MSGGLIVRYKSNSCLYCDAIKTKREEQALREKSIQRNSEFALAVCFEQMPRHSRHPTHRHTKGDNAIC